MSLKPVYRFHKGHHHVHPHINSIHHHPHYMKLPVFFIVILVTFVILGAIGVIVWAVLRNQNSSNGIENWESRRTTSEGETIVDDE